MNAPAPRVDFYVLPSDTPQARERLACRLADKAYRQGHRIYIQVEDERTAERLDELLWTFQAGSFIPHAREPLDGEPPAVVIGREARPELDHDVLLNLGAEVPGAWGRFQRVLEIVEPSTREAGRVRFRHYRDRGCTVHSHTLDSPPQAG